MGRTKTSRYRNWRKQMRKRGQSPLRKSYTWDTPHATREREQLRKMEKAMDVVGKIALVIAGLLAVLVIIVQVGKRFYGW